MQLKPLGKIRKKCEVTVENSLEMNLLNRSTFSRAVQELAVDIFEPREIPYKVTIRDNIVWKMALMAAQQEKADEQKWRTRDLGDWVALKGIQAQIFSYFSDERGLSFVNDLHFQIPDHVEPISYEENGA